MSTPRDLRLATPLELLRDYGLPETRALTHDTAQILADALCRLCVANGGVPVVGRAETATVAALALAALDRAAWQARVVRDARDGGHRYAVVVSVVPLMARDLDAALLWLAMRDDSEAVATAAVYL